MFEYEDIHSFNDDKRLGFLDACSQPNQPPLGLGDCVVYIFSCSYNRAVTNNLRLLITFRICTTDLLYSDRSLCLAKILERKDGR